MITNFHYILERLNVFYLAPKENSKKFKILLLHVITILQRASDHVKYLGVIIDNHLSGEHIVDSIVHKVNNRLRFLYRQAMFLDVKCKMSLCSALITCHMDYACSFLVLWSYNYIAKKKLQVCQNKVVRFILDLPHKHSINYSVLSGLNLFECGR